MWHVVQETFIWMKVIHMSFIAPAVSYVSLLLMWLNKIWPIHPLATDKDLWMHITSHKVIESLAIETL